MKKRIPRTNPLQEIIRIGTRKVTVEIVVIPIIHNVNIISISNADTAERVRLTVLKIPPFRI